MFQSGIIGLLARLALYLAVARALLETFRLAAPQDKDLVAALFASAMVLIYMMTNVLIFSKQLNFLFWTIAAVGVALRQPRLPEGAALASKANDEEATAERLAAPAFVP